MDLIQTLLIAAVTLGILVAFHEYGHFWVARRCGVKVLRFSVGFGAPLYKRIGRDGTEYTLGAIPLGGYVKMLDEREGDVPPELQSQSFNRQSVWARMAIVAAGPIANFILAIVVFWALFLRGESGLIPIVGEVLPGTPAYYAGLEPGQEVIAIDGKETPTASALSLRLLDRLGDTGVVRIATKYPNSDVIYESEAPLDRWLAGVDNPDPLSGFGIALRRPTLVPTIESVVPGGAAAVAGVQAADRILAADGVPMVEWSDWVEYVRARPGQTIEVLLDRGGRSLTVSLTPARVDDKTGSYGSVGMSVQVPEWDDSVLRTFERGPVSALIAAVERTGSLIVFTFESMWKMLKGLISPNNLSGPITIAQVAANSAESGLFSWLGFLALLSISLGALNLLPVPVLDGGHLVYFAVEALTGKAVPERAQMLGYQVGVVLVLSIMAFALYNDFARL
jgi:regulator of sigma E protease